MKNEIIKTPRDSEVLCLTPISTFQKKNGRKNNHSTAMKPSKIYSTPPNFCKRHFIALLKTDAFSKFYSVKQIPIGCDMWGCPVCRIYKAKKLKRLLQYVIVKNDLKYMLTLTLDPKKIPYQFLNKSVNFTGKYISYLFNIFLTKLRQKKYKNIKYIWVKEFQTESGNAHLHLMFNIYPNIKHWRYLWTKIGGGTQMYAEPVRDIDAVSKYYSKYVTKMIDSSENFTVGERRFTVSKYCAKPPKIIKPKITFDQLRKELPLDDFFMVYNLATGFVVSDKELIFAPHQEKLNI